MDLPENTLLPFFAYGVFQPGELAFIRLKAHVREVSPGSVSGRLHIRDGLPLLDPEGHAHVAGSLIAFHPESAGRAYFRLVELEPDRQYQWRVVGVNVKGAETDANTFVGLDVSKGSAPFEGTWQGRDDPFFKDAFQVVEETQNQSVSAGPVDLQPLFRVQMGYLLLWSVLERYAALRYHLAGEVAGKVDQISAEPAFAEALKKYVSERREVFRADDPDPDKRCKLNRDNPKQSLRYYYQVRCNASHRGKGAARDYDVLLKSSRELLPIARDLVRIAFHDAQWDSAT